MKPNRRLSFATGIVTILVAVAFIAFAPEPLGGQANYVVVNGVSMEPGFHKGDLAIVRKSSAYQVGDVATYRHPEIGHVIHRIIGKDENGRFLFQGDNNDYVDPYHPAQSEMVGKLWIHIPKVGGWMTHLREPRNAAIVVFFALAGLGGGGAKAAQAQVTRTRRKRRRKAPPPVPAGSTPMNGLNKYWQDIATILGVAAAGLGLLALVAFNGPTERTVPQDLAYKQSGEFTYTAPPPAAPVYDTGAPTPGEPVFRRLTDGFSAGFTYRFESSYAHQISGSYRLLAEVSDDTGWRRTLEIQPETAFQGDTFTAGGAVSLAQAQELIDTLNNETGVKAREYALTIEPQVHVTGTIDGEPFSTDFSPRLPFELDELQVRMAKSSGLENDPLRPSAEGVAPREGGEPNTISLLMLDLTVSRARLFSVMGLGVCLVVGGVMLLSMRKEPLIEPQLAPGSSRLKLTGVVNIRGGLPPSRAQVVDVATIDDLARIAEATGGPVLQEVRPGHHAFFVCDTDVTYRFQASGRPVAAQEGSAA